MYGETSLPWVKTLTEDEKDRRTKCPDLENAQTWKMPPHCEDAAALVLEKPQWHTMFLEVLTPAAFGLLLYKPIVLNIRIL